MTTPPDNPGREGSSDRPWLRTDLALEERVEALLAEMTLAEKVGQTHQAANVDPVADAELIRGGGIGSSLLASGATAGNERDAGIRVSTINAVQRIAVDESRLGIPLVFARDVIHGHRTVFPIPLGLAASSLGEAPALAGRLGAAMVRGFQGGDLREGDSRAAGSISACAEHFVGYGLVAGGRDYETVQVGENTLRNLHLRPFRAAVDAGCATVMAAFTDVDGVPMHAHRRLLREVLKDEWGFDDAARRVIRLKIRQGLFERPYVGAPTSSPAPGSTAGPLAPSPAAGSLAPWPPDPEPWRGRQPPGPSFCSPTTEPSHWPRTPAASC